MLRWTLYISDESYSIPDDKSFYIREYLIQYADVFTNVCQYNVKVIFNYNVEDFKYLHKVALFLLIENQFYTN